jgi:TolB protein
MKVLLVAALLCCACDLLPGGGGGLGGGAGGGGVDVTFNKGFAFVRKDDKNVYVSDQSDFSTVFRLTTEGGARQPSLSKDGRRVVFVRSLNNDTEIVTLPSSGGTPSTVLAASSTATARNFKNPIFNADGTRIIFGYEEGASGSLGIVNTDGSGFARLAGGSALTYAAPSLYADGMSVLAAAGSSTSQLTQLEKIALATGAATNVASTLGNEAFSIASRAVVSPDGSKAVFDARLSSGSVRIFVIDLTSKVVNRVTDYPAEPNANDSAPCWMGPDKVCFSSDSGGNDQLYALPADSMRTSGGLQLPSATEPWFGPN